MASTVDLGVLEARVVADIRNFQQNMGKAQTTLNDFGKKSVTALNSTAQKFRTFGYLASAAVTVPVVAAGKAAVVMAKNYEFSMQKIVGLAGVAQNAVNDWNQEVLKMAPNVAKAPTELAEALYFISSSGIKGAKAMDVLTLSAKAASAGLGETQSVANLLTSVLNAYAGTGMDAAYATDILVAAVREGKAEATGFASAVGQIIPIAAELGVSFNEVAGGMAAITLTGSTSAQAATYLKGVFNSLLKATAHGEKALNSMGSSYAELRHILKDQGLIAVMQKMRDMSTKYGEEVASDILPNIRALSGYLSIAGKNFEYNKGVIDRVTNSLGSMDSAWEAVAGTIQVRLATMLAKLNVSLISFGNIVAQAILPFMEKWIGKFENLTDWLKNMSEGWRNFSLWVLKVIVLMGPLSLGISLVTYWFSGIILIIGKLIKWYKLFAASIILANSAVKASVVIWELWYAATVLATQGLAAFKIAMSVALPVTWVTGILLAVAAVAALAIGIGKLIKKKNELSTAQKITKDSNEELSKSLAEQRGILDVLTTAIKDQNTPYEVRAQLLKEFNDRFGEYLPNLLTETNYLGNIDKAYDEVNKKMTRTLTLQAQMGMIKEISSERVKKQLELVKAYKNLAEARNLLKIDPRAGAYQIDKYTNDIANLQEAIIELGGTIKLITDQITKDQGKPWLFTLMDNSQPWLFPAKGGASRINMFEKIQADAKKAAEAARKSREEWEKLRAKMGIIEGLQADLDAAEDRKQKATTPQGIAQADADIKRITKLLESYDKDKVIANQLAANKVLQQNEETALKGLQLNADEENAKLYQIRVKWIDAEIDLYKGNAEKVRELVADKEQMIMEETLRRKKIAAEKVYKQLEVNAKLERLVAERNAELTIKDEEDLGRAIEDIRIKEAQKLLDIRKMISFYTKTPDKMLEVDQKALDLDKERNSIDERDRLRAESYAKANALETQAGMLAELERNRHLMGDKQYAAEYRAILVDTYNFKKSTAYETALFLDNLSRNELNRTISRLEEDLANFVETEENKTEKVKLEADIQAAYKEKREKDSEARRKSIAEAGTQSISMGLTEGLTGFAAGIGNAVSGMEEPFNAMRTLVADFLIDIGKALIATALLSEAFQELIKLGPIGAAAAIVAGVAAIAVGTYLKNKLAEGPGGDGQLAAANGAIVYGPTNVLAGEYSGARNNPEVISPLSKLKGMIQDAAPVLQERLVAEIGARELRILLKREDAFLNRT